MTRISFARSIARFCVIGAALFAVVRSASARQPEPASSGVTVNPALDEGGQGRAPHAPPPAIVLRPPPPPELPPLEYARRPFELVPEVALAFPSCTDGSVTSARCQGLGAGAGLGSGALWRFSPYFAFGATLSALRFGFVPPGSAHLRDGSASAVFYGLLGRVYFSDRGPIEPYLELGLGGGSGRTNAREMDGVTYSETATGGAVRVGGAVEVYLGSHARLGPAFDWTRFRVRRLLRCGGAYGCAELGQDQNGHGVGFLSFSARLTILLGPGL